jgi:predicted RNA-binding protein with PIN domain
MKADWLIVDGYSLLHRRDGGLDGSPGSLMVARERLIRQLEEVLGDVADRITVVFDGTGDTESTALESEVVEVIFSPSHRTADTVVERMVYLSPDPARVLVVTSDRAERDTVAARGAHTMSCGDFLELCARRRSRPQRRSSPGRGGPTLGDFFPR